MTNRDKGNPRLDAELLEMAQIYRGTLIRAETADKITKRILGDRALDKPAPLTAEEILALRENARMSQSVFASLLNVTPGYLSAMERGEKAPKGSTLALLHVVRRAGVAPLLEEHHP